jgi:uncharacterized phage protein (TIGR01671 family)
MRDIDFRCWNKHYKEMYTWEEMIEEGLNYYSDDDFIWMQYTGLKDRNGVEIYEGDIVRFDAEDGMFGRDPILGLIGSVEWDFADTGFYFNTTNGNYPYVKTYRSMNVDIIGNQYEHPELLKGWVPRNS